MHKLVGINSLRFFAIVFIVTYHLFQSFLPGGFIAVELFFCISGFLVTSKIVRQAAKSDFSYRRFLLSRLKRIYPSLLICVLLSLILCIFINADVFTGARKNTLTALTFTTNISELITGGSYENTYLPNIFEHTWFVALLFQFYLLAPLLLMLFTKIFLSRKTAIRFYGLAMLILGIFSIFLMVCYGGLFDMSDRAYFALDSHMAALCFGSAFAVFNYFVPRPPRTVKFKPFVMLLVSIVMMTILATQSKYSNQLTFVFSLPLASILSVIILICVIRLQRNIHARRKTLNAIRIFESLGNLSYGIYLFHWPLIILLPHLLPPDTADWGYAVIDIILSIILASVLYRFFSIEDLRIKIRHLRRPAKISYSVVALALVSIAVISLVRAPQTSSIAQQLSSSVDADSEELIAQTAVAANYVDAGQIIKETVDVFDTQLRLAGNVEILPAPSGSLAAPNANAANVLVIGDSVTLGAKEAIEATIAQSFVDAKENRAIDAATGILANYGASGRLPAIIIVSLVTNQRTITESLLQDIVNVAGSGHKFIFVTGYAGPLQPREEQNSVLKSFAANRGDVYIADWWELAHNNWSLMYADHIHLNPSGRTAYAILLSNVIRSMR